MDTVDELVATAFARSGLNELSTSGSWRPGLELLVSVVEKSSTMTSEGRERMYGEFVEALSNRLRVEEYARTHPEIDEQRVERPLVVLGMPRTGTTVASYLLDQDPRRRSLLNWEAEDSIPPPTSATLRTDERCRSKLERQHQQLDAIVESGVAVPHWEWADGPTECIFVHTQDFKAYYWDAMLATPVYSDWLLECDMSSAYDYEKRVLQILQTHAPGRWSLKMPSHAIHIETLLDTFPDVRMVWAHRDPYKALGSLCSAQRTGKGSVAGGVVDLEYIGQNSLKQIRAHIDRATAARDRIGDERFFDLHYAELMRDPIGQMQRLYEWDAETLTPDVEKLMQRWMQENPQGKFGRHTYSIEEFGLSVNQAEPYFSEYIDRFGIELEDG